MRVLPTVDWREVADGRVVFSAYGPERAEEDCLLHWGAVWLRGLGFEVPRVAAWLETRGCGRLALVARVNLDAEFWAEVRRQSRGIICHEAS